MKIFLLVLLSTFFLLTKVTAQTEPDAYPGLKLWLRSSDNMVTDAENVVSWEDKRSNGLILNQNSENQQGILLDSVLRLNGYPSIKLDGVNDFYTLNESQDSLRTIFILTKHASGSSTDFQPVLGHSSSFDFHGTSGEKLFHPQYASNGIKNGLCRVNQVLKSAIEIDKPKRYSILTVQSNLYLHFNQLSKDRSFSRYWNGEFVEIIGYSEMLDETQIEAVETYLLDRYSPPIDSGPDLVSNDFCEVFLNVSERIDSLIWSTGDTTNTISVNKSGKYYVDAFDVFGRHSSDTINVTFPGTFIDSFTLCSGSDSLYTPNLEAFDLTWQDGSTDPNYLITEAGEYSLTVTDSEGCSYSDTIAVTEDFFPTQVELTENPNFCLGNELYLSSGFAEAETYDWSTGEDTPYIQPQSSGTYWVEATNANGCVGRDTVEVELVGTAPEVAFTMGTACEGNAVEFNDTTFPEGGTVTSAEWVFGGAQTPDTLTGSQVETTFPETGSYPVELTVTLDNGCTGTGRDTVRVEPLPLVGFNYDEVTPCAGNEVAFESQSGVPGNGSIASFAWAFDNGTTATGFVGSTTFESLGVHTVQHIVTTTAGCSDSLTANVVVLGSPIADFSFEPVCVGMPVVFNQQVDTSMSGPVFYNWQFGDGYFSNFPNTAHVYAGPGVYEVQLTATGNDFGNAGCKSDTTKTVRVYAPPAGMLSATDGCMGTELELTDTTTPDSRGGVTDPVVSRAWTLPYGYGQGPVALGGDSVQLWMPQEAGTYAVQLDFTTAAGCTGEASGSAEVLEVPVAAFELEVPATAPPVSAVPVNTSSGAQGYAWLIDGNVVSTEAEPELLFADTGTYSVGLAATNSLGCNDTAYTPVTVISPQYDIALLDIRYTRTGDRLKLKLLLSNKGNTPVEDVEVDIKLGLSAGLLSGEVFALAPGEVAEFALPRELEYLPTRDLPYICVDLGLRVGGVLVQESDTVNNSLCVALEKEQAVFIDPWPNPATGQVNLGFVLPAAGELNLKVVDSEGREVGAYRWDLREGYSLERIDVSGYSEGLYLLRFSYGGEVFVERVVVSD